MKIARYLNLPQLLEKTGKTFLIHEQLADRTLIIDLLRSDLYLRFSASPSGLQALIAARSPCSVVVIDEVQNDRVTRQWLLLKKLESARGETLRELTASLPRITFGTRASGLLN